MDSLWVNAMAEPVCYCLLPQYSELYLSEAYCVENVWDQIMT